MHQGIDAETVEIPLTHVVCPNCNGMASVNHTRSVGDGKMGLALGMVLDCEHCHQVSFLILSGHPHLLNLDITKHLITWQIPEV